MPTTRGSGAQRNVGLRGAEQMPSNKTAALLRTTFLLMVLAGLTVAVASADSCQPTIPTSYPTPAPLALQGTVKYVAASDSLASEKAAANYQATGSNDQTVINTALTAAGTGGTVVLDSGHFYLQGSVTPPAGTQLLGMGKAISRLVETNSAMVLITNSKVTVGNMSISGHWLWLYLRRSPRKHQRWSLPH